MRHLLLATAFVLTLSLCASAQLNTSGGFQSTGGGTTTGGGTAGGGTGGASFGSHAADVPGLAQVGMFQGLGDLSLTMHFLNGGAGSAPGAGEGTAMPSDGALLQFSNNVIGLDGDIQMVGLDLGGDPQQGQVEDRVAPIGWGGWGPQLRWQPDPGNARDPRRRRRRRHPPAGGPQGLEGMMDIDLSGLDSSPATMVGQRRPPTREGQAQAIRDAALQEVKDAAARAMDPNAAANRGLTADQMRTREALGLILLDVLDGTPPDAEDARLVQDHKGEILSLLDSISPSGAPGDSPLQQAIDDAARGLLQACKDALPK